MNIGEVGILTSDVKKLADFYKKLFEIENDCDDDVIQFILTEGTGLTIHNDGKERRGNFQNICLAFTVDDVDAEFERLKKLGVEIIEPPTVRPWGAKNMLFNDPDGNSIIFRSVPTSSIN
ncbi:MAG: VOC family protein [Oscillospiraceae bacterium]|nr:VOC family protein [Oscillospiraceae bacterium]